jgi:hypothetical protein
MTREHIVRNFSGLIARCADERRHPKHVVVGIRAVSRPNSELVSIERCEAVFATFL